MDPYDSSLRPPYSSLNNPFPHSLLRARESKREAGAGAEQDPKALNP